MTRRRDDGLAGATEDPSPGRVIVFSDAHGEPDTIRGVLEHSGYDPHVDRLLFAGDAIDVGRDSWGCLELLDEIGAECLVGNHEWALFVDWPIEAESVSPEVDRRVRENIRTGRWRVAAEADGVLITHAGVGMLYLSDFDAAGGGDVARFAAALNEEFEGTVENAYLATEGVVHEQGPLWWRPGIDGPPLPGVTQVIGHTPPEILTRPDDPARYWAERGIHLVDPCVRRWRARGYGDPAPVRYAVIEGGGVRVVER